VITRHDVAGQLKDYLQHRVSLEELVDWAERAMMEEEFDPNDFQNVREIVSRLGLANVRAFGLEWEDFEKYLTRLGYQTHIEISPAR
jgi:hypothetical protein